MPSWYALYIYFLNNEQMLSLASGLCSSADQVDLNLDEGNTFSASSDGGVDARDADNSLLTDPRGWEGASGDATPWIEVGIL